MQKLNEYDGSGKSTHPLSGKVGINESKHRHKRWQ